MPNRIIKESICTSEQIDALLPIEEVAFYRLLVNCDDYGCFDAREKVVKSRLFPLRDISTEDVHRILDRLSEAGLIQLYEVDGKSYLNVCKWADHQRVRVSVHKYPMPPQLAASCGERRRVAANGGKMRPESNPIQSESLSESLSESFIADEDAKKIQTEHDRVLDAAEDAGFKVSNSVRANLLKLYADYGLDKMLAGFDSCVKHGAPNLAYLEACLKGGGQKKPSGRVLPAQDFEQRDYSDVPAQNMAELAKEIEAFNRERAQA